MNITCSSAIIINAPEYFQDEAFLEWLNNGNSKLTSHVQGHELSEESERALNAAGLEDEEFGAHKETLSRIVGTLGPNEATVIQMRSKTKSSRWRLHLSLFPGHWAMEVIVLANMRHRRQLYLECGLLLPGLACPLSWLCLPCKHQRVDGRSRRNHVEPSFAAQSSKHRAEGAQ